MLSLGFDSKTVNFIKTKLQHLKNGCFLGFFLLMHISILNTFYTIIEVDVLLVLFFDHKKVFKSPVDSLVSLLRTLALKRTVIRVCHPILSAFLRMCNKTMMQSLKSVIQENSVVF